MTQPDTTSLRKNITFSIVMAMLLLIIITGTVTTLIQKHRQDKRVQEYDALIHQNIEATINHYLKNYTHRIQRLIKTTRIPELLKQKDREGMERLLGPQWELMKEEEPHLAVMQLHLPDGTSFLRMHKPGSSGDQMLSFRPMLKEVQRSHKVLSGYETGRYASVYRSIVPIFDAQETYLGALEMGLEPNFILHNIQENSGFPGLIFVKDEELKLSARPDDMVIDGYRLQSKFTREMEPIRNSLTSVGHLKDHTEMAAGKKRYMIHAFTLNDFKHQAKIKILFFQDISKTGILSGYMMLGVSFMTAIVLMLLALFVYRRIGSYHKNIVQVYHKQMELLDKSEKNLRFNQNYLQGIFDSTPNIMVVTDGDALENATPAMLTFFGYETIDAFNMEHSCICDFFLESRNGDECLQADMQGLTWLEYMYEHPYDIHKVCMMHSGRRHIFIVQAKPMKVDEKHLNVVTFIDITETEEIKEQLQYAVNGSNDGLWDWDIERDTVYYSPRWKAMLGYKEEELSNRLQTWKDRVHPDDREKAMHDIAKSQRSSNIPLENIHRLRHKDGDWIWILDRAKTVFDKSGKAVRMVGFHTDITKQKNLENELRASKLQFDLFMLHMPYMVTIKDESYRSVYTNRATDIFLNKQALGKTAVENLGEQAGRQIHALCERAKREGKAEELIEYTENGQKYILRALTFAIPQNDGKVYTGIIYIDITQQHQDQYEIAKLQQVLEKSPVSIVLTDIEGNVEYVNPWFCQLTGYRKTEVVGKNMKMLQSGYTSKKEYAALWHKVSNGHVWSGTFKNFKKDGQSYWESAIIAPVTNENGKIVNYIGIKQEITDKIRMQEELAEQKVRTNELGTILEESLNEIYIFSKNSLGFFYANKEAQRNTGYSLEELFMMTPVDLKPSMTVNMFREKIKQINGKNVLKIFFSTYHQRKDGTKYPVDVSLQEITFEGVTAYMAIIIDTTEREAIRKEMREQEKVMIAQSQHAAMGEMIGMIAHQWRQPITVIAMGANNMLVDIELDGINEESVKEEAENILTQTEYLSKTIDDFRSFFLPDKEKEMVDLEDVMKEAQKIIGKTLKHSNTTFSLRNTNGQKVKTYSRELLQVFINLLKNANEALVENRQEDRQINVLISDHAGSVMITVCDNGGGVDEAIIHKIFDPYFSTKDKNIGTGLGLHMSKTIIEKHMNGRIELNNTKEGACFKLTLPLKKEKNDE